MGAVQDAAVLDIGARTDADVVHVAADDGGRPISAADFVVKGKKVAASLLERGYVRMA